MVGGVSWIRCNSTDGAVVRILNAVKVCSESLTDAECSERSNGRRSTGR
jgi:hypothetical protein